VNLTSGLAIHRSHIKYSVRNIIWHKILLRLACCVACCVACWLVACWLRVGWLRVGCVFSVVCCIVVLRSVACGVMCVLRVLSVWDVFAYLGCALRACFCASWSCVVCATWCFTKLAFWPIFSPPSRSTPSSLLLLFIHEYLSADWRPAPRAEFYHPLFEDQES
jgi:hypothetical protein